MSRQLAHTLVSEGSVKQADIEDALQRQVLFGGSLGTNLLEASVVTEDKLLEALGSTHKLPTAGKKDIDEISAHIPRLFPQMFAESYHLVPHKLDDDTLGVLVTGRPDEQLLERIRERLAIQLSPSVTSEVRLHYAMNHLYGTDLLPRFKALVSKLDGVTVVHEPAATKPAGEVLSWGVTSSHAPARTQAPGTKVNLRDLLARLEFATNRDAIIDILLRAIMAIFEYAALFLVQGQTVNGWRGADQGSTARTAQISMPVELPSVFQTIYATGGHYLGPLPTNSANAKLLEDMGRQPPRAAFVAPLIIGGKMAMIVYADNGQRVISPRRVAAVLLLTQRASIAFERLIRKRKAAASQIVEDGEPPGDWEEDAPIQFDIAEETPEDEIRDVAPHEYEVIGESPIPSPVTSVRMPQGDAAGLAASPSFTSVDQSPGASTEAFEKSIERHAVQEIDLDSDYVAFTDIEDDAEEALDGWGDVLIETADTLDQPADAAPEAPIRGAPPSVTWDDVIAETAVAASLVPRVASTTIEVAGTIVDEKELLFDSLLATNPQARRDAVEKLLRFGADVDEGIGKRFPGDIKMDPLDPKAKVPPFAACSGVTELILARGGGAAGTILPFLDHDDPVKRFFAIYYLLAVPYPKALDLLARRLYDTEPRNRHLAADALRMYTKEAGYQRIIDALRGQLKVPILESRVSAVQLLGQLRDPASVPELIPLIVAPEPTLSKASVSGLAVLCAQDFGGDVPMWSEWWRTNYNRPRPVWLIQGLRHASVAIRKIANYELQLLTGMTTHFDANAAEEEREEKTRMWENWWLHLAKSQEQTPTVDSP